MKISKFHAAFRFLLISVAFSLLIVAQGWAGGGQHYPNGAEDFAVGALPPPEPTL